jgi:histone deacetylase 1/2
MRQEYASLLENDTFTYVEHPRNKPIGCKWIYKTKTNPDGTTRYKAGLVIKGYAQVEGIDFDETYAPVGKLTTLRYLMSLLAQKGWKSDHLDVVTAFLNPKIDAEVYMQLPDGIEWLETESHTTTGFLKLNKALYGLRQAPRLWYEEINNFLLSTEFTQSHADPNLYIRYDSVL